MKFGKYKKAGYIERELCRLYSEIDSFCFDSKEVLQKDTSTSGLEAYKELLNQINSTREKLFAELDKIA